MRSRRTDGDRCVPGQSRVWEIVGLLTILAIAAWLRLRELDLMEFKLDESVAIDLARRLLDGTFPTVGLRSSVGAQNPPLFIYLTAIPLSIRDDPVVATAFVGVVAVVALALMYAVLRPRFGALAALAGAAFFAAAPWAVLYGRKIWAQDFLPVLTISLLWCMFVVLERRRTRAVFLIPVLLCLTFQLNFSALALALPASALLLYRARDVNWRAFAVGIGLALSLLAPWLIHEATHGLEDVRNLGSQGRGAGGTSVLGSGSIEAIRQTFRLVGPGGWEYVTGSSQAHFVAEAGSTWALVRVAGLLAVALLLVGLVSSALRVVRSGSLDRRWPFVKLDIAAEHRALLVLWLAGIWLSFVTSAPDRVPPHYLIVAYPVSFALQALGLSDLVALGRHRRIATVGAIAVIAVVMSTFVTFTVSFHNYLANTGGTKGDYGSVYRDKAALARAVREKGLRVGDDEVLDFLVVEHIESPVASGQVVSVRDRSRDGSPLPCDGTPRPFGLLVACFP